MLFDDVFLSELSHDFVKGVINICDETLAKAIPLMNQRNATEANEYFSEAMALLETLIESNLIIIDVPKPDEISDSYQRARSTSTYLFAVKSKFEQHASTLKFEQMKLKFKTAIGGSFAYEFSQGDLEKVQTLLSQLRDQIVASKFIEKEHQQRILRRLEKLQSELHKRVSDLDRFWGLIGDAGVALGKFGTDAKPIVDRIKEITEIVWQTQSRAEELPSGTPIPQLENKPTTEA